MAQKSLFFNSDNHDRIYDSADFARYFSKYFTNGIFNDGLKVKSNDNMTVSVSSGSGNINGYFYDNEEDLVLDIETSDTSQSRIDSVILRLDLTNRQITAQVLKGSFASSPVKPALTRNTTVYDLRLADILVEANTTRITTNVITDTRLSSDCGIVIGTCKELDTSTAYEQYDSQFNDWFKNLKTNLDGDVAGNLQNQINDLKTEISTLILEDNKKKYPIGKIILSMENVNPSTYLGFGTWTLLEEGLFLRSTKTKAGVTSGSDSHTHTTGDHTLTTEEMPRHHHALPYSGYSAQYSSDGQSVAGVNDENNRTHWSFYAGGNGGDTSKSGTNEPHNHGNTGSGSNVPKNITCYIWQRTA